MLERINLILLEDDVDDFIHDFARDILGGKKSIESLLEEANYSRLSVENVQPYILSLQEIFDHTMSLIHDTSNKQSLPIDFDTFIKDNNLKINENKEWYEIVYKMIRNSLITKSKPSNTIFGMNLNSALQPIAPPSYFRMTPVVVTRDRIKERNNLEDEVQILSGFKEEQLEILKDYGQVSGLWSGLAVLIYACIVGIAIPSILTLYPLEIYDNLGTKKILLGLFFSQLIALFLYLGISMYKLTNENSRV